MASIHLYELEKTSWFRHRKIMKEAIIQLFRLERVKLGELSIIFCDDAYLLRMNRKYLQHNEYTDIISFDLSADNWVRGELYISIPRIKENAKKLNHSRTLELQRVIFHGCLHLCGYRDKLKQDKAEIRAKEDKYLHLYSIRSST
jgi:probable rRNA maturation factor